MARPNWPVVCALVFSLVAWGGLAEAGYRVSHHGRSGLRHALYAHAAQLAHRLERLA